MPLCSRDGIDRFERDVAETSLVAFQRVTLSPRWFGPGPSPAADVMFKALDNGEGCILLVEAGLRYTGADAAVAEAFENGSSRGWRPLAVIRSIRANAVLRFADDVLGLSGQPPQVPRPPAAQRREIIVPREEISGQLDGDDDKGESRFGVDLVAEASGGRLDRPLFRDRETAALVRILSKAGKNAACLTGEPGTGKTAVVEGLAIAVAEGRVPPSLEGARILDVNLSFLGAGASMRGEFEARVKDLVELARRDRKTVLFLDELHTLRSVGSNASQMLKADLGRGRISCIGATTTVEWRQIEADGALARRFQMVRVEELSSLQAAKVLRVRKPELECHHGVVLPDELIEPVVKFSVRHLPDRRLPDKALDLLDEAGACAAVAGIENTVTLDHVGEALSASTGIPADYLRPGGMVIGDSARLRASLHERIFGQEQAISVAVQAMFRRGRLSPRAGERRPMWTALFAGPSGVGKSQFSKELARLLFGDADRHFVQIDLSDFRDEHTVARLVGAPPGYKGHGDGGELTNAIRRVAAGVLLLDEVEKAHPAILTQVLVPLLGEASLHDMNDGRLLDASQFLIVMTSNLGSGRPTASSVGFGATLDTDSVSQVRQAVAGHFPKEILGRIDDVIVFSHLSESATRQIWEGEVKSLSSRLSADGPSIDVQVDDDLARRLLKSAKPRIESEGARAIRKLFDRVIADRCLELLGDSVEPGRVVIHTADDGSFRCRFEQDGGE